MEKTVVLESANLPAATEYRVHDGKVESRTLNGGPAHEEDWTQVSAEQLSSHVLCNTAVARWLERNLGWRRLLRACVGQEPSETDGKADRQVQAFH
jgi:hypothetical protein